LETILKKLILPVYKLFFCFLDMLINLNSKSNRALNKKTSPERKVCAVEQIRTAMLFTALPPQGSASTNFATTASKPQM
jgi:hypothetical protein